MILGIVMLLATACEPKLSSTENTMESPVEITFDSIRAAKIGADDYGMHHNM